MNRDEALEIILGHGSGYTDANGEPFALDEGFLGMLRPYEGLREANFHELMQAVFVLGAEFHSQRAVDRELVESLWSMCTLARHWGLDPKGMLRRNNLITPADQDRLDRWIDIIESSCQSMLRGRPPEAVVEIYAVYVYQFGIGGEVPFFVDLLVRALETEADMIPDDIAKALGAIGAQAECALPTLRQAAEREYTWFEPHDRCTAETRELVKEAIASIEDAVAKNPQG